MSVESFSRKLSVVSVVSKKIANDFDLLNKTFKVAGKTLIFRVIAGVNSRLDHVNLVNSTALGSLRLKTIMLST